MAEKAMTKGRKDITDLFDNNKEEHPYLHKDKDGSVNMTRLHDFGAMCEYISHHYWQWRENYSEENERFFLAGVSDMREGLMNDYFFKLFNTKE